MTSGVYERRRQHKCLEDVVRSKRTSELLEIRKAESAQGDEVLIKRIMRN